LNLLLQIFNFFTEVVMPRFAELELDWGMPFVMNLINCMSMDDINSVVESGNWAEFVADLTGDMDKFRCVARVPRTMSIYGIKAGMFNINANGLSFFEQIDFSNFFNIDFNVGFTAGGFDLSEFGADFDFAAFDFTTFNAFLQPYFAVFDIFNLMGLNLDIDTSELNAENIVNFNIENIANAFEQIAMFMLKYEFQSRDFDNVVVFGEAVTEWMNDFLYWFNNLGAWVDSVNARQAYIFSQLGWDLENADNLASWAIWAANPTNWGQLLYGTRSWMSFQDVMDKLHDDMDDEHKEVSMGWMQLLSGQDVADWRFSDWAMDGMENGFGYASEAAFWTEMDTTYRNSFADFAFFDNYKEGIYEYNAGGVIAVAACMHFTEWTVDNIDPFTVDVNNFGEKFDGCFYMYYNGLNAEWF